jgi:peptidoglycan-associated lipoprotein
MMLGANWASRGMRTAFALAVVAGLGACAEKEKVDASIGQGGGFGKDGGPVTPGSAREFAVKVGDTVYFTTDSTDLTPDAQTTLRSQAQWLKQYPQYTVTVEGHADERGTREYNIGLGAKRSANVRTYLASQGIEAARMRTISYGKERPVAVCNDISCWSQNRRSQTALNKRAGS